MNAPVILIIGTADTKADELLFLKTCVEEAGARARIMDVGVLGVPPFTPDYSKHDVALAAGTSNADIIALGDEDRAMTRQAEGAANLASALQKQGEIHGMLAIGGSMATDLALDVAAALPLGFPKCIASTVAFSPILPPQRISPDLIMILWAGGLFGLNSICKSALSQAAGAVVGACRASVSPKNTRPIVGMTSLGSSSLKYMLTLKPALEQRGYELAVFHTTGMGGRAFEALAANGSLAAVMDFSLVEVSNYENGSVLSAGSDRLESAGAAGIPQIVAPGGVTLMDFQTWLPPVHKPVIRLARVHNLLANVSETIPVEIANERDIPHLAKTGPGRFSPHARTVVQTVRIGAPRDPDHIARAVVVHLNGVGTRIAIHIAECEMEAMVWGRRA